MNPDAEADLIGRCRRGEARAWDELFEWHYAAAGRFVFQLAADLTREDIEEICQETFLSVIRSFDSFNAKSRIQTWVFRIAANKARDYRERQRAAKRGGGTEMVSLTNISDLPAVARLDVLALDEALTRLAAFDPGQSRIVELLCFGGLTVSEAAEVEHLSERTVHREWKVAKAWLYRAMQAGG